MQKKIEVVVERERDESKSESESVQRRVVHTQTPLIGAHSMCESIASDYVSHYHYSQVHITVVTTSSWAIS